MTPPPRPSLATIVTPRPWEGDLVRAATDSGLVRLVARAYNPADIPDVDAIVIGSEVPWLRLEMIHRWRRAGTAVIGIFPLGDTPAIEMFCRGGVDQLFADFVEPIVVLRAVRDLARPRACAEVRPAPPLLAWERGRLHD